MKLKIKRKFTYAEKEQCWNLWQQGLGYSDISKVLNSKPGTIFGIIRITGGYAPRQRKRNSKHLSLEEREEISRGIAKGKTIRSIADLLSRAPSTISREIKRNGNKSSYRAAKADERAWQKALRPKACKLARHPILCNIIAKKLSDNWSPQQISGWLKKQYDQNNLNLSHETIYKSLYIQSRNVLSKELLHNLRRGHKL